MKTVFLTKKFKNLWKNGMQLENTYLVAPPGMKYALKIGGDDVTVKNVIIHHASSGQGIFGHTAHNLYLENVEVRAYGTKSGPNPCPKKVSGLAGYNCANIFIDKSNNVRMHNIRAEGGSKGISMKRSPDCKLTNLDVRNTRGAYPGG